MGMLWEALRKLWDAFGRLGEALGRLWGGFGGALGGFGESLGRLCETFTPERRYACGDDAGGSGCTPAWQCARVSSPSKVS